mgnify:CR=1 FL=1
MELKQLFLILTFISAFVSNMSPVKADFGETIATLILFIIITTFVCAGIGWWHKRNESKY